jgi:hypothetical protein
VSFALVRDGGADRPARPAAADPDGGRLFARWMLPLEEVPAVLGWVAAGQAQAEAAGELAAGLWGCRFAARLRAAGYVD